MKTSTARKYDHTRTPWPDEDRTHAIDRSPLYSGHRVFVRETKPFLYDHNPRRSWVMFVDEGQKISLLRVDYPFGVRFFCSECKVGESCEHVAIIQKLLDAEKE